LVDGTRQSINYSAPFFFVPIEDKSRSEDSHKENLQNQTTFTAKTKKKERITCEIYDLR